jgi:hypothetical protein
MAPESIRERFVRWRVEDLLIKYSGLRLTSAPRGLLKIAGVLAFVAEGPGKERIDDEYQIELSIPDGFPGRIPSARETGGRIPPSFHKLHEGDLCLGSPTRLRLILTESPSILRFVERCVIPYLYGHSYFERHSVLPFGELKHGEEGIREDLASLFGTDRGENIREFVRLTAMRRRQANKQSCPCGSQRRLGRCHHRRVNTLRRRLGRHWFRRVRHTLREDGARRA